MTHFVFKLDIVIHHYESKCHAKRLIGYFTTQGDKPCFTLLNVGKGTISDSGQRVTVSLSL